MSLQPKEGVQQTQQNAPTGEAPTEASALLGATQQAAQAQVPPMINNPMPKV